MLMIMMGMILPVMQATTWNVGPSRMYTYCSQVAPLVADGDTILIDAAVYDNDPQVQWKKNNLYIAGIGGRPRLQAGSIIANDFSNGKGIFVAQGSGIHIHNIEFANARVPDNNGAGIRQEGANLLVTHCKFDGNEMGILGGNVANCKVTVEYCEFVNGGSTFNPGYQHNIYINHIDTLVFRYNYSYNAIAQGHEFKSRATHNIILYNRIANEDSEDSRTIDIPNGGISVIMGNVIEQGPNSANTNILGYGLEGLSNPGPHELYCINNTFINKKDRGSFIQVQNNTDKLMVWNNIMAGMTTGGLINGTAIVFDSAYNWVNTDLDVFGFADQNGYDYHLRSESGAIDGGVDPGLEVLGYHLFPSLMYRDTCGYEPRSIEGAVDIGAFEFSTPLKTNEPTLSVLDIFPNPAHEVVHLQWGTVTEENLLFRIYGWDGKLRAEKRCSDPECTIDVSQWPAGIYLVTLQSRNAIRTGRVVVQ